MAVFGAKSRSHLDGTAGQGPRVHPMLVRVAEKAVEARDFSISDGGRTIAEQRKNVEKGVSQTMASKHLPQADGFAHAIDTLPYPVPGDFWKRVEKGIAAVRAVDPTMQAIRFYCQSAFIAGVAHGMGVNVRPGFDWDEDGNVDDHVFLDLPHIELQGDGVGAA